MRSLLILSFFLSTGVLSAQITFEKVITQEYGHFSSVIQTADGGYAAMGESGYNGEDKWLVRADSVGDTLWTRVFPGRGNNHCGDRYFTETEDGGFTFLSRRPYKATLYHVDASGDSIWEKEIFPGIAYAMNPTAGGYLITGVIRDTSNTSFLIICKANDNGSVLWNRTYQFFPAGTWAWPYPQGIRETREGGYMVAGYIYDGYFMSTPFLLRTSNSGDSLWYREYPLIGDERFYSLDTTKDGGFVACGSVNSYSSSPFIIKVDSTGDTLWTSRNFITARNQQFFSVISETNGGYIACGSFLNPYSGQDSAKVCLMKLTDGGSIEWERKIGTYGDSYGYCISRTRDNGFIIGGQVSPFVSPSENGLLIKVDANGNFTGTEELDKSAEFKVFPNPATDHITFTVSGKSHSPGSITFYNLLGKEIYNSQVPEGQSMIVIPTVSWNPGMYLYVIRDGNQCKTGKICIINTRE